MNNRTYPRVFKYSLLVLISILLLGLSLWGLGYRLNFSDSYPKGIWRVTRFFDPILDKGRLVLVHPPKSDIFMMAKTREYLRFGFYGCKIQPLLKRVVGLESDCISVTSDGVRINGVFLANSKPLHRDSKNRTLTKASSTLLKAGEAWVMSEFSPKSFDSRYFGPIPVANIMGVVESVWLWE